MPEHLRALVVILVLALPVFALARRAFGEAAIDPGDFNRRRNLWIGITLVAFLAHNFWFYVLGCALLLVITQAREANRLALFLFVLLAIPPFGLPLPGFGPIQQLFSISHPRVLSLVVLMPAFFSLLSDPDRLRFGRTTADKFLIGYMLLQFVFQALLDSFTGTLRGGFVMFLDIFLPYYVASRSMRDLRSFTDALTSFVVAALLLTPVALFESVRHWLLYNSLDEALGLRWTFGNYLGRGESLRAVATVGHAIALGYVMVVGVAVYVFVSRLVVHPRLRLLGWVGLAAALLAPLSRGPWVGALAALALVTFLGPNAAQRIGRTLFGMLVAGALVWLSPWSGTVIDHLPFVGTVDTDTFTYRQRLVEVSLQILKQNPMFGVYDYMTNPAMEEMRQGEGIIDMVNTYLGVAMAGGLVSLTLFAGVFAAAALGAWRSMRLWAGYDEAHELLGRALLASLVGILVTIGTVSPISVIPLIYWTFAGLAVGYAALPVTAPDPIGAQGEEPFANPAGLGRLRSFAGGRGPG